MANVNFDIFITTFDDLSFLLIWDEKNFPQVSSSARMVPSYHATIVSPCWSNLHCNCSKCVWWGTVNDVWCWERKKIIVICGENIQCTIYFCAKPQLNPTDGVADSNFCCCHSTSFSAAVCLLMYSGNNHNFIFLRLFYGHINVTRNGPGTS